MFSKYANFAKITKLIINKISSRDNSCNIFSQSSVLLVIVSAFKVDEIPKTAVVD